MVKTSLKIVAVISLLMLVDFYILGNMSKTGKPQGLISGRLSPCSDKPNCVVSEIAEEDSHYISPLHYPPALSKDAMALLKEMIQKAGGQITAEEGEYMAAAFTSTLLGFVDDLECRNDRANHAIHLRSASRVGHSDFGVNKRRVALISNLFYKRIKKKSFSKDVPFEHKGIRDLIMDLAEGKIQELEKKGVSPKGKLWDEFVS